MKKFYYPNKIGFMQGRLVDKIKNNIQYFPGRNWKKELNLAIRENYKLMEWTINYENINSNPLYTGNKKDLKKILSYKKLKIKSVTCDFFMQKPFFKKKNLKYKSKYINDILKVINNSNKLNFKYLILPLVDGSSIKNNNEEKELINTLKKKIIPKLKNIKILFEINYPPRKVVHFIEKFKSNKVGINYDTGNSASLNYNIEDEFMYFKYVKNIHIKDRLKFGSTVRLGKGNWKYKKFFKIIRKASYDGNFILQTARSNNDQHIKELNLNRKFLINCL